VTPILLGAETQPRELSDDDLTVSSEDGALDDEGVGSVLRRVVRGCGIALSVLVIVAMVTIALGIVALHVGFQPVLSASMRPTFSPGSVVITRPIATTAIRPGDVLLLTPPGETSPFAHRVTSVTGPADHPIVTTKGDANPAPDPWKDRIVSTRVPKVIGSVPRVGRFVVAMHGQGSRLILLILGGLIFCIVGTRSILGPRSPTTQVSGGTSS
jgi:signal peptidase I